jgi:8-oxo-dGTP pyrophosphatase MutT (NUDIX family)
MQCTKEERYSHGSALRGLHGLKKFYSPVGSDKILKMLKILSFLPRPVTTRLIQGIGLVRNPFTLGVRVIVEDEGNRVLLVRHSYVAGWYLPGGGVDKGETMEEAACREVLEEAGVVSATRPQLLNIFLNEEATGRDHVGLYHLSEWREADSFLQPNAEIEEAAFFALEDLPEGLTRSTARRLEEFRSGRPPEVGRW